MGQKDFCVLCNRRKILGKDLIIMRYAKYIPLIIIIIITAGIISLKIEKKTKNKTKKSPKGYGLLSK